MLNLNDILPYLPVLGYFSFASIMFLFRKFIFGLHSSILIIATVINCYITLSHGGNLIVMILQVFFAVLSFVLMVPFFAGKASGETMLAFTALVALPPLALFFTPSLIGFILAIGIFVIFAGFKHRDKIGDVTAMMNDLNSEKSSIADTNEKGEEGGTEASKKEDAGTEHNPGTVKDILTVGLLSTYDGQFKLPDYSYLPDASSVKKEERLSFSIFALSGYALIVLFNIANALFFLDH